MEGWSTQLYIDDNLKRKEKGVYMLHVSSAFIA